MIRKEEIRSASAVCAAIVGAGFASGREVESFFARLGTGSWLGVPAACAGIGFLTYVIMTLAQMTDASSFPELYGRLMDNRCRDAMHLLYGLMMLMTSAAMVAAGGELGALALDIEHARFLGSAITLLAAAAVAVSGLKALGRIGLIMSLAMAASFTAMLLRPGGGSSFSWSGLAAATPMGMLYAAFNAALAGGVMVGAGRERVRSSHVGFLTGILMLVLLIPANWALLRAGASVRDMALPAVVMAARWGSAGYYIVIALMGLAVLTTLSATLTSLRDQLAGLGLNRAVSLTLSAASAALMSVCGFELLVNLVYPMLGWVCAFALLSLLFYLPARKK